MEYLRTTGWRRLNEADVALSKVTELAREGQDEEDSLNGGGSVYTLFELETTWNWAQLLLRESCSSAMLRDRRYNQFLCKGDRKQ
jgi:hypothetical protein